MRIAHVDTGATWRGGQAQVAALIQGLVRRGHECVLFCPEGPLAERVRGDGGAVRILGARSDLDLAAAWRLARALRRERPAVVHLHSARAHAVGVSAARLAGRIPVVVSRRVDFAVASSPWSAWKYRHGVDRYLAISKGVARVLRAGGVAGERISVVPSGIDPDRWRALPDPAPLRRALGIGEGERVVGSIAALAPHKDHATLLSAAARLAAEMPEVRWLVAGEGECRRDLEAERSRLGLEGRVLFPGFLHEVGAVLSLIEVFVLSSYLEGLGTSVLDAQAAGVPVVATAVGGVPEMVQDGENGWLVPARDPQALAGAVAEALGRPDEARRRAQRARVTVRTFSLERTVAGTERAYREVCRERPGAVR